MFKGGLLNHSRLLFISSAICISGLLNMAQAQNCSTQNGVNLTDPGKSFANIIPRDQGRLGLCFSYAATDLLRSHTGATSAFNVFDAAVNSDEDADGGDPSGVMKSLINRGWACTDTYKFQNMFPSSQDNILTELEKISMDMPVFYTNNLSTGEARQKRIADKAAALNKAGGCDLWNGSLTVSSEIDQLYKDVDKLNSKSTTLRNELNALDWGWVNYLSGSRDNSEIQKDINAVKSKVKTKENRLDVLEKKKDTYEAKIAGKYDLDKYNEDDAAQIVYYWAKKTYPLMRSAFTKYGVDSKQIPTFEQYVTERVKKDPVNEYAYAGRMYGYKVMKQAIANSCQPPNRQAIRKNITTKSLTVKNALDGVNRIKGLLEKGNPQGAVLSLHSSFITKGTWTDGAQDNHAVVVVGCRTVNGQMQLLIHNSWGQGCGNIYKNYSCTGGRFWVPATSALQASSEVEWLEN